MKKRFTAFIISLAMALTLMPAMPLLSASAEDTGTVVRLDPSDASPFNNGEFQGWGTSLCWWANRIGYSEELTQQVSDAFFSENGLGLDIARYNLGGGDDPTHNHITRSDSKIPCYATSISDSGVYTYDWTVDENQRNVAIAAKTANPDIYFEGFSNSPPWFITNSGCSSGAADAGNDNLSSEQFDNFGTFIADVTKHFKEEFGITFESYSPMNEPDTTYWGAMSPKQEGAHYSPGATQSGTIVATRNALDEAGLSDVLVAGMDETDIDKSVKNYASLTAEAKEALGRIDTHTYNGSQRAQLKQTAINAGKDLWMSEVDGGWNGFGLAERIILDMNGMQPAAWVIWDIIDSHKDADSLAINDKGVYYEQNNSLDITGSMWGVGMADHDTETLELANKYYFFGQFTKYINPGDTIIASSSNSLAAYNKHTGDIKIVALNSGSADEKYTFDLSEFTSVGGSVTTIRTDNGTGASAEHWKEISNGAVLDGKKLTATLKAKSLTTFVVKGADSLVPELSFNSSTGEYSYTVPQALESFDKYVALRDEDGMLKGVKSAASGSFTNSQASDSAELYVWDNMQPVDIRYMKINGFTTAVAGAEYSYTAELGPSDIDTPITWSVSDNTIATVSSDGTLTTLKGGSVTLTATAYKLGVSTSVDIKVMNADQKLHIINKKSGKALETKSKGVASGTPLMQWTPRNIDTAAWSLTPTSDGYFNIINANADMLLVNSSGSLVISDSVEATSNDAKWDLISHGDYYEIKNIGAGKSLDVSGQSTADGGSVILYNYSGGDNELWTLSEISGEIEHVVPVVVDYSKKYDGTDYDYVSNVASVTNDFSESLNGFAVNNFAGLGSDGDGEPVLFAQNSLSNTSNTQRHGTATLDLLAPVTCEDGKLINLAFDFYPSHSDGTATATLSASDGSDLVKFTFTSYATKYTLNIGDEEVESSGNGAAYFKNNYEGKDCKIANGGHVEIYYRPSDGFVKVTVKNNTNSAAMLTYTGAVDEGLDIKKLVFDCDYTQWNKQSAVGNLVTNIIEYAEGVTPDPAPVRADPTDPPALPESGELIHLDFNSANLDSSSSYGAAAGSPNFVSDGEGDDQRQCIRFDGTDSTVVTLTDANGNPLLTGQENITISFKVKPTDTGTSWWMYAAPNNNAQQESTIAYLGVLEQNEKLTIERYNGSRAAGPSGNALTLNEWHDVIVSVNDNVTSLYVDGAFISSAASKVNISDMLGKKSVAYIGLANWGSGEYAKGYLDDFIIYNYAFDEALAGLDIGDTSALTKNITLPSELDGTAITWTSSDDNVISDAGEITRTDENQTAVLTAAVTVNGVTLTKGFDVTVKGHTSVLDTFAAYAEDGELKFSSEWTSAEKYDMSVTYASAGNGAASLDKIDNTASSSFGSKANGTYKVTCSLKNKTTEAVVKSVTRTVTIKTEENMEAYLFVHFVGNEGNENAEQIYFSASQDGTNWKILNGGNPVLKSTVGEKGVRDPYIIRGEDGKFYIIATDLSIYNRRGDSNRWSTCQTSGSKNIVVWESNDLGDWSGAAPRLVEVADSHAGCTWAPEAIYDPDEGKYMVFWASKVSDDGYKKQRMYRSYTTDFTSFTPAEVYIDNPDSTIDTTITQDKGIYYRFTKDESHSYISMEKSASLSGGWKYVDTYTINGKDPKTVTGYEGPTIYKMNGTNDWCLLLDLFSKSKGYFPFVTSDLSKGVFTSPSDFKFPSEVTYRHGTVMPITLAEYNKLLETYPGSN